MLIFQIYSLKTLAQTTDVNLSPRSFSCLTRPEQERLAVCFKENVDCHEALFKQGDPFPSLTWQWVILAFLAGGVAGLTVHK